MADREEFAEADAALVGVMEEVGERPCPPGLLRSAAARIRAEAPDPSSLAAAMIAAAGLEADNLPADDAELWLALATGVVLQPEGPTADLPVTHWLCTLAALVLWGPGTQADAPALATCVSEAEGSGAGDIPGLEAALAPVVERWRALEALDVTERLTPLGWWGLPEAQRRAWSSPVA